MNTMKEKQHKYVVMYFSNINRHSERPKTYFSLIRSIEKGKTKQLYELNFTNQVQFSQTGTKKS